MNALWTTQADTKQQKETQSKHPGSVLWCLASAFGRVVFEAGLSYQRMINGPVNVLAQGHEILRQQSETQALSMTGIVCATQSALQTTLSVTLHPCLYKDREKDRKERLETSVWNGFPNNFHPSSSRHVTAQLVPRFIFNISSIILVPVTETQDKLSVHTWLYTEPHAKHSQGDYV